MLTPKPYNRPSDLVSLNKQRAISVCRFRYVYNRLLPMDSGFILSFYKIPRRTSSPSDRFIFHIV